MTSKYSVADKDMFIQILGKYHIIEDKRTDAYNIHKKKTAWGKIVTEYNAVASEKRTVIQLKRLWDKIKRNRKGALAKERRELMATGGGPSKPPPSPKPEIDNIIPHLDFEIDIDADSDGINLHKNSEVSVTSRIQETPGQSSASDITPVPVSVASPTQEETPGPLSASDVNLLPETPCTKKAPTQRQNKSLAKNHLTTLTHARLTLIDQEKAQMEELHRVRMREARYKEEAARLIMLQEEAKLKKIENS